MFRPGDVVKITTSGAIGTVVGWFPCGHLVVSVDGQSIAVPPRDASKVEISG